MSNEHPGRINQRDRHAHLTMTATATAQIKHSLWITWGELAVEHERDS